MSSRYRACSRCFSSSLAAIGALALFVLFTATFVNAAPHATRTVDDSRVVAQVPGMMPSPAPGEDPAATARAKDWWNQLQTGPVDFTRVDPSFAQRLTPQVLAGIKAGIASEGTPTDWIYIGSQNAPGATLYQYWIRLAGVPHVWTVGIDRNGKIVASGIQ